MLREQPWALSVFSLLLCGFAFGQEATESPRQKLLKKRDQEGKAAEQAQIKGDYALAITSARSRLSIESQLFGANDAELIGTVAFIAEWQ